MREHTRFLGALLALTSLSGVAGAQTPSETDWQIGAVVDVTHSSRGLALGARDQGLQLGHSDITASGPLGRLFKAQLGAMFETHDGQLEMSVEEAWIETTRLPAGLQVRGGRFASQIGYLNQQHSHADDFVERPLLYRAFFGGHWNDDGLRLNWTAPTPFYLMVGAEAFRGHRLVEEAVGKPKNPGMATLVLKTGADLNREHSWQLGLSHVRSRRVAAEEAHDHGAATGGHDHDHAHGAQLGGRKTWMVDATWKWSPGGNNRDQQVRLGFEAARITGLNAFATARDKHEANAISLVWRFRPEWEVGARADWLRGRMPHEDHFDSVLLREHAVMVAWKPSHMQSLRLQYTAQRDAVGFEKPSRRTLQLQYVMAFGAHGAHAY